MRRSSRNIFTLAVAVLAMALPVAAQSTPAFAPPITWAAPGASAVASGDMNGDGRIDVITANGTTPGSHGVSVLLSNGDGTFQTGANFVTNTDPTDIVVADFNGDGKLDVATANKTAGTLSILLGNGDGTLQQATLIPLPALPGSIQSADFNGDGKADLAVVQLTINPATGATTYLGNILMSNGDGTFSQATFPLYSPALTLGDFNGDGKTDMFVYLAPQTLLSGTPGIRFGVGDGTFIDSALPFAPNAGSFNATAFVTGDFNGDGKLDIYGEISFGIIARSGGGLSEVMALGNGDGTFTVTVLPSNTGTDGQNLITGDFNRDGKLDVAGLFPGPLRFNPVPPAPYQVRILYGNGDGTFAPRTNFPAGSAMSVFTGTPLVAVDFDGNGALDFALPLPTGVSVVRNANGNPPLIASLKINATWMVGGNNVLGTVTLGDVAPAAGYQVALSSSDPAASFPGGAILTIPTGATSATFTISTGVVAASTLVNITASAFGASQVATFNAVPQYVLASMTTVNSSAPGLVGGTLGTSGTLTLSSPATDGGVVINLTCSNPAILAVTPSVTVLPGVTTVSFTALTIAAVPVNTPVTITATLNGVTKTVVYTVTAVTDVLKITKAEYVVKTATWTIEGIAFNPGAVISVLTAAGLGTGPGGGIITIKPSSNGSFKGQGTAPPPFTSVLLRSSGGGTATSAVAQK